MAAHAEESRLPVAYAGIAFVGDEAAIASTYPVTSKLVEARAQAGAALDGVLYRRLQPVRNPSFDLVADRLLALEGNDTAIAVALAIDRETISVEQIGGLHKLLVGLAAQALFFDYKRMTIVAAYPVTVEYIDVLKSMPDEARRRAAMDKLLDGDLGVSLVEAATAALRDARLKTSLGTRVQVRGVTIDPRALAVMPARLKSDPRTAEALLAQEFSKFLSGNQNVPVLPHAKGQAIGNKMAMRFSDGSIYNLQIPEPDYVFDLTVQPFKKIEHSKTAAGATLIYGAFLRTVLVEPLSGRVYMDLSLKNGETKVVPASQSTVDDWAACQDTLLLLIDKFTTALSSPTAEWATKHAGDAAAVQQMAAAKKVIESCK